MTKHYNAAPIRVGMLHFAEKLQVLFGDEPQYMPHWAGWYERIPQAHDGGECVVTRYGFDDELIPWRGITGSRQFSMEYHAITRPCGDDHILRTKSHESLHVPASAGQYDQSYTTFITSALTRNKQRPLSARLQEEGWDKVCWALKDGTAPPLVRVDAIDTTVRKVGVEETDRFFNRTLQLVHSGLQTWIELGRPSIAPTVID